MLQVASGVAAEFDAATFTGPGFPREQVTTEHCPVWALVSSVQSPATLPDKDRRRGEKGAAVIALVISTLFTVSPDPDTLIHI